MTTMKLKLLSVIFAVAWVLGGCAQTPIGNDINGPLISPKDTPKMVYNKLVKDKRNIKSAFAVLDFGLSVSGHPFSQNTTNKFYAAMTKAEEKLKEFSAFLSAHPEIANTPAAELPESEEVVQLIFEELKSYIKNPTEDGLDYLPILSEPTTQP
jgi:hypothetical protein